ncbi:MAG: ion transporter [Symploca sp. SIO2C1]|nr:ion transporter [Symploca sp. SIO2C1]
MLLRKKTAFYLQDIETPTGRAINFLIMGLILLSSVIFVADTYPIPTSLRIILDRIDYCILIIFVVEYLIRFWCAETKISFLFHPLSIIDLVAIIPFFIWSTNIRFIRILRWFRILRLIRFINLKIYFLHITTEDGVIFARILFTLFTIVFIFSGLIYQVEHGVNSGRFRTFLDAVYFSIVTMTTVGFGDVTPISEAGRLLTLLMIMTGIVLIPWQLGDLIKQLLKTANKVDIPCGNCGCSSHDADAQFCKACGTKLEKASGKNSGHLGPSCQLPPSELTINTELAEKSE